MTTGRVAQNANRFTTVPHCRRLPRVIGCFIGKSADPSRAV